MQDEKEEWKSHMDLHLQKKKKKTLRTDKGGGAERI